MIIRSQRVKKAVLTALADEEMVKILDSTSDQAKSVRGIISEKSIPYTNAYRKTKCLVAERLLIIDKIILLQKERNLVYLEVYYLQSR